MLEHEFCHPERSEGSHCQKSRNTSVVSGDEVLRCARGFEQSFHLWLNSSAKAAMEMGDGT
jgi:hypothetical protein